MGTVIRPITISAAVLASLLVLSYGAQAQGAPQLLVPSARAESIAGPDKDGNGIRDDAEAYIIAQYADASQRAAAMQLARALQAALVVNAQDRQAVKDVARKATYAVSCIFSRFQGPPRSKNPAQVIKELEGITANSKPRLSAYLAYNKALDGVTSPLPDGDTCE